DGLFIADILGVYDVYQNGIDLPLQEAIQLPVNDPLLLVSAMDDHIALWQGTWQGMKLFGGEQRFILAESGHIAGIINPPAANKYGFWHSDASSDTPDAWLEQATHQSGSWWP
ncbi:hypothetical protein ACWTQY_29960, partial [Klebsiella pneumoniae]